MKNKLTLTKKQKAAVLCCLPFAAFGMLYLLKTAYAAWVIPWMPPCLIRTLTGKRCPSCGMTHSVFALCRLDFAESLRQNALVPFGVVLAALYYAELWTRALGKPKRLFPRSGRFWLGVIAAVLLYTVLRNILSQFGG